MGRPVAPDVDDAMLIAVDRDEGDAGPGLAQVPAPSAQAVPVGWPAHSLAVPELELLATDVATQEDAADAVLELAALDAVDELAVLPVAVLELVAPPWSPVPPPPVPERTQAILAAPLRALARVGAGAEDRRARRADGGYASAPARGKWVMIDPAPRA